MEGYLCRAASDGIEALDLIKEGFRPCVIFLDLMLPRMDGREFLQKIRRRRDLRKTPVIVLSGDGQVHERTASMDIEAAYLKPIEPEVLLKHARKYCK
jgi:CheY-like chemotaxis protein